MENIDDLDNISKISPFKRGKKYEKTHVSYSSAKAYVNNSLRLSFSIRTFRDFLESGEIPSVSYGGYKLVSKNHLREHCEKIKTQKKSKNIKKTEKLFFDISTKNHIVLKKLGISIPYHP